MKRQWRFALSAILLACTAIVLQARNQAEIIPPDRLSRHSPARSRDGARPISRFLKMS